MAGIVIGLSIMFQEASSARAIIFVCLGLAAVLGMAAALFGERFWTWLGRAWAWLRWW
jgi:hypothetical protein